MTPKQIYGILAEFKDTKSILKAAESVKIEGYINRDIKNRIKFSLNDSKGRFSYTEYKRLDYFNPFSSIKETIILKDQIWGDLFKRYKVVKTTYPISWSGLFTVFSYPMEKYNIKKNEKTIYFLLHKVLE